MRTKWAQDDGTQLILHYSFYDTPCTAVEHASYNRRVSFWCDSCLSL